MTDARSAAFAILSKMERDHAYSNLILSDMPGALSCSEKLLAHRLVKSVLERKLTLDYTLSRYLTQPLKKLKPQVLTILRMGACQLFFMDKIPPSAAINESVKLAKKNGCAFAAGLINAVLRKAAQSGLLLPDKEDFAAYCSIQYSFPEYLCRRFFSYYGEETTERILASSLGAAKIYIRKNTLKPQPLTAENEPLLFPDGCRRLLHSGNIPELPDFQQGLFHVQDISSQICCAVLSPQRGETVLDICAAPGGKTMTLAQMMKNEGTIIACDVHEHKLRLIRQTAERLGVTIVQTLRRDGTEETKNLPQADRILCDVPCSGFGVTGKKPEIKYKKETDIASLPSLQLKILENASRFLKKGGRLVYSTCTLLPEENRDVCRQFLQRHENFAAVAIDPSIRGFRDGETLTILPFHYDGDGFFLAAFERIV